MSLFLIALAIFPGLAIAYYTYKKDLYEKEPIIYLFFAFLLGVFSIIPTMIGYGFFDSILPLPKEKTFIQHFIYAFIIVAITEETAKFIFLRFFFFRRREFDEAYDGIVYAVFIGMGFATFENIMYVAEGGVAVGLLRIFTAVPAHAIFGVTMGFHLGLAKFEQNPIIRTKLMTKAWLYPVALHGAYDFCLMQNTIPFLGLLAMYALYKSIKGAKQLMHQTATKSPFNPSNQIDNTTDEERKIW
ncbi:MAG: PrsW family intramembrane metalloprotease [Chitinophagales bacterium]|nr:PrsW family intramembrane metalloprotease [Chitinophagales bacterium]